MASERNFRPSSARAALVTFIAAICILALLAAPVSAQSGCQCTRGRVIYRNVRCYYYNLGWGDYAVLNYNTWYGISCQTTGGSVGGNNWWNRVRHGGRDCYVNDYYLSTGCETRCWNLGMCPR